MNTKEEFEIVEKYGNSKFRFHLLKELEAIRKRTAKAIFEELEKKINWKSSNVGAITHKQIDELRKKWGVEDGK